MRIIRYVIFVPMKYNKYYKIIFSEEHCHNLSLKDIKGEVWFDINGRGGIYKISNFCRVKRGKSFKQIWFNKNLLEVKEKIVKIGIDIGGYYYVPLTYNKISTRCGLHRLMAQTFIPNPFNKEQVNHKNGIKTDNRIDNLEWATAKENNAHALATGLKIQVIKNRKDLSIPVVQLTSNGTLIKEYPSMSEVERQIGISHKRIRDCVCGGYYRIYNGGKKKWVNVTTVRGFKWKFKNSKDSKSPYTYIINTK